MNKRVLRSLILVALLFILVLPVGAGGKQEAAEAGKVKTIKLYQSEPEITEQLDRLVAEYETITPGVEIEAMTAYGGDYATLLKTKFAGGEEPDIFHNYGSKDFENWLEHLEDLSDQPWVDDLMDLDFIKGRISSNGKVYGMPVRLEGYGLSFNKDLFSKAGINTTWPYPVTTLTQLKEVIDKLNGSGATPFSVNLQDFFEAGFIWVNNAMAKQSDPDEFIKGLNDGSSKIVGNKIFEDWTYLIDLFIEHCKDPFTTDYDMEVTKFAKGEAAMIYEGVWIQNMIDQIDPNLNVGTIPVPLNDDPTIGNDRIFLDISAYWVINNKSKVKPEAKEFLNWYVTSDTGRKYMVKEFKYIPAFKSIKATADCGSLSIDIVKYAQEGKYLGYQFPKYPDGATEEFGAAVQKYAHGKTDRDQLLQDLQSAWDRLKD